MNSLKTAFYVTIIILFASYFQNVATAATANNDQEDQIQVSTQQVDLLKSRLDQADDELARLQRQQDSASNLTMEHVDKAAINAAHIDLSVAKSNVDSVAIEVTEAQQTILTTEHDIQDLQSQMDLYRIFGAKTSTQRQQELERLEERLMYHQNLLAIEKKRLSDLQTLSTLSQSILQLYRARVAHIERLFKSQTIVELKTKQTQSEISLQQQQNTLQQQLNALYARLNQLDLSSEKDKTAYVTLKNDIFYVNENLNFTYLQILLVRYQDQVAALKLSITQGDSLAFLNKMHEQVQMLLKQLTRLHDLLEDRKIIMKNRIALLSDEKMSATLNANYVAELTDLQTQYATMSNIVLKLNRDLLHLRDALDQELQQVLSARQGLPGFGQRAWIDLGAEIVSFPSLSFQYIKNIGNEFFEIFKTFNIAWWLLLSVLEIVWISGWYFVKQFLQKFMLSLTDYEFGHLNLTWLTMKVFYRMLIGVAVIGNIIGLSYLIGLSPQYFNFLMQIGLVWIVFRAIILIAKCYLVETVHNRGGYDVQLYYRLRLSFLVGGLITAFMLFANQLPMIYEVQDLLDRLFLVFLIVVSVFLLKARDILTGFVLPYIDERRTYLQRIIHLVAVLIPSIVLINAVIGVLGYVNFVLTMAWYESIFLLVLILYLIVRGLLSDGIERLSYFVIRHVHNGWLWTEAVLKPLNKVLRIFIFLLAWIVLFLLYGWDRQSPVVERLSNLMHYHLFDFLNTSMTPLSIIELGIVISLLYWTARWTREFVYRLLASYTQDIGIRNTLAILSQYTMIVVVFFIGLRVLGIDFRALAVVAGMFAFGVGLGLRDLANNFACGFLLLFERPLRVGDIITVNDYEGEVMHIGGRAVTMRTWDYLEVIIPNSEIFSKSFVNWTGKNNIARTVVAIDMNPENNPHRIQTLIYEILRSHPSLLKDPSPEVYLKEMEEGHLHFEIRYFVDLRQIVSRTHVRSSVLMMVWDAFEKEGIKPPYSHHEVILHESPLHLPKQTE